MKRSRPGWSWSWLITLWLLLPAPLYAITVREAEEAVQSVLDRAFCEPSATFAQSPAWTAQPIRHERWAQNSSLAITLDQQIHQLLFPLITRYAQNHKLNLRIREGTCGTSAGLISRKSVDIAGFCCPPGRNDRLPGLTFHTLGIASIAILVHPDNPVNDLQLEQVKAIFQGKTRHWSEIVEASSGLAAHQWPVQTIGRLHCKLRPGHWRALLGSPDDFSPRMEEVGAIPDMIQRIMAQRGGIGFETLWHVERHKHLGRPKAISLNGQTPDNVQALLQGAYPLYHVFNLTLWKGERLDNPQARALVTHLIQAVESMDPRLTMIPATALRQAGWRFQDEELIGEPVKKP